MAGIEPRRAPHWRTVANTGPDRTRLTGMGRVFPMLWVADVAATVRFYEEGLGGLLDHAHDDWSYAEVRLGSMTLGIVAEFDARRHLPVRFRPHAADDAPGAFELYFEVFDAD